MGAETEPEVKAPSLCTRKRSVERKTPENAERPGLLRRALGLLLIAAVLYLVLAAGADLVTARLYDLVWAVADS